jgi:hypothetical protein
MCYSLEASIAAGVALAAIDAVAIWRAFRLDRKMLVFAFFPAVFSIHQFIEAGIWRSMRHPFEASAALRYAYVVIAFLVWPILAPVAAATADRRPAYKNLWRSLCACGLIFAAYLLTKLLGAHGVEASVVGHSIQYDVAFQPDPPEYVPLAYLAIAALPVARKQGAAAQRRRNPYVFCGFGLRVERRLDFRLVLLRRSLQRRDFAVHSGKSAHRRAELGLAMNNARRSPNRASIGLGSNLILSANSSPQQK